MSVILSNLQSSICSSQCHHNLMRRPGRNHSCNSLCSYLTYTINDMDLCTEIKNLTSINPCFSCGRGKGNESKIMRFGSIKSALSIPFMGLVGPRACKVKQHGSLRSSHWWRQRKRKPRGERRGGRNRRLRR